MARKRDDQPNSTQGEKQQKVDRLVLRISEANVSTLTEKVAWILNHYPEARDSDITCQIRYWETFEPEYPSTDEIDIRDLYRLTRLTSIARARAKIQNEFNLFLASPEIRKHRGKLSEEEKQKSLEQRPIYPVYTVYADESGKTQKYLIVGTMWIVDNIANLKLFRILKAIKEKHGYSEEIHFKNIRHQSLPFYLDLIREIGVSPSLQ